MNLCSDVIGVILSHLTLLDIVSFLITSKYNYSNERKQHLELIKEKYKQLKEIIIKDQKSYSSVYDCVQQFRPIYSNYYHHFNINHLYWRIGGYIEKTHDFTIIRISIDPLDIKPYKKLHINEYWRKPKSDKQWQINNTQGKIIGIKMSGTFHANLNWFSSEKLFLVPKTESDKILISYNDLYQLVTVKDINKTIIDMFSVIFNYS